MENKEIRWKQHFQNYEMAFLKLKEAIEINYRTITVVATTTEILKPFITIQENLQAV